jgi:hypothetical protein
VGLHHDCSTDGYTFDGHPHQLLVNIPEFNPPRAKNYDGDTAALMRMHWHIVLASDPAICVGYYLQHRKPRIILCGQRLQVASERRAERYYAAACDYKQCIWQPAWGTSLASTMQR